MGENLFEVKNITKVFRAKKAAGKGRTVCTCCQRCQFSDKGKGNLCSCW